MLGHRGLRNAIFIHKRPYDVNGFLRCHGLLFSSFSFFSASLTISSCCFSVSITSPFASRICSKHERKLHSVLIVSFFMGFGW